LSDGVDEEELDDENIENEFLFVNNEMDSEGQ